jgi:cytochrome c biogenesis factor
MDPTRELGRWLLLGGLILAAAGAVLLLGARLPFRLGRLPGDIAIEGRRGSFFFPVVTCLLLSALMTLLFWLVGWMRR